MYAHGDHVHKLCKVAWFYSPHLEAEDLASIKRMIDIQVAILARAIPVGRLCEQERAMGVTTSMGTFLAMMKGKGLKRNGGI